MRWTHPLRGAVPPAVFIPVAEESGLILRLGEWALDQGCQALLRLAGAGQTMPLSINVSPSQFRQASFVQQVKAALARSGADATQLIFEITEGLLIKNVEETIALIEKVQPKLVVNLALPYQDLAIMDACLATKTDYLDTANYEPRDTRRYDRTVGAGVRFKF